MLRAFVTLRSYLRSAYVGSKPRAAHQALIDSAQMPRRAKGAVAPFLKWAGGKGQLLHEILPRLPARIDTYYEPFVGGGAVFFALASERRFRRAVIADRNADLVGIYRAVRDDLADLVRSLDQHARHACDAEYFYRIRSSLGSPALEPTERAARLIYLNKTCFNGLYRTNRSGQFNVPFGRYANPTVCNEGALCAASVALAGADIRNADFEEVVAGAGPGDAVYFDPPYMPLSRTSSFTAYHALPFGENEHRRLARVYRECCGRRAAAVLSNSDQALTRDLYRDLDVLHVKAARAINSVASKRGAITEILVLGPANGP